MKVGNVLLVLFSHFITVYLWSSIELNNGELIYGTHQVHDIVQAITPNAFSICFYLGFILVQFGMAMTLGGVSVKVDNRHYKCNGFASWWCTLSIFAILHLTHIMPMSILARQSGALLGTGIVLADLCSIVLMNVYGGSGVDDFVEGSVLHPRVGGVCLKMFVETRISWTLLFLLDVSYATVQLEELHYVTNNMWCVLLLHFLYANACHKGEMCIPYTWDITTARFGFTQVFWNIVGVSFTYTANAHFICTTHCEISDTTSYLLMAVIVGAYIVFDQANGQKNIYRARTRGREIVYRWWRFPQLPFCDLGPNALELHEGSKKLLVDGWWALVRKPHYTADMILSLCLGLSGGSFRHIIPFYFPIFFIPMLVHRAWRDNRLCEKRYGKLWKRYVEHVPKVFV